MWSVACFEVLLDEGTSVTASNLVSLEEGKSKDSMKTNSLSSAFSVDTSQKSYPPSLTNPVSVLRLPLTSQPNLSDLQVSLGVTICSIPAQSLLWRSTEIGEHQSPQRAWPGQQIRDRSPDAEPVLKPSQFEPHHCTDPSKACRLERTIPSRSLADLEPQARLAATCPELCSPPPAKTSGFCSGCVQDVAQ